MRNERGSALILAVMAMLIMGVLSVSFALLADIESRVGVAYKQQGQAEALAEAGLEMARDAVQSAPTVSGGFTNWFNGTTASHMLFSGAALNGGQYWGRIDNDCASLGTVPAAIQEATPCNNTVDKNEVAVITAWATSGAGRSRVRAVVGVDNPWKHVCADAKPDNNGYCNEPGNRNGSPTVTPADPNDPNGPNAYKDLPRPMLGCSRVARKLHRGTWTAVQQDTGCASNPAVYTYPYPVAYNAAPRFVVMGEDPASVPTAKTCNNEPGGGNNNKYWGYFDCALTTPCNTGAPDFQICPDNVSRKGCLRDSDSRVIVGHPNYDPLRYVKYDALGNGNQGICGGGGATETGMVLNLQGHIANASISWGTDVGSKGSRRFDIYMYDATLALGNNKQVYATLVVEGNENNNWCADKDFVTGNGASSQLWAGPNVPGSPPPAPWSNQFQYGYPLAVLVYNPDLPPPTIEPTYAPQGTCADMGSNNSEIHGMIYSAGHVQFNPLIFDGTVVAFEMQTTGSAQYIYNTTYGTNTPPPGFPFGSGNQVVVIRKSFVVCVNYNDDSGGPTGCN